MSASRGAPAPPAVAVVTAVKSLGTAKSRFAAPGAEFRDAVPGLVLAMLRDTLAAALATPGVRRVLVVSPDPTVRAAATAAGAVGVDEPRSGGLNAALDAGAAAARADGTVDVVALQADLPALTPAELAAFVAAAGGRRAFVPDRAGTGTAALYAPAGEALRPMFGPDSAAAHRRSGARPHPGPWPGLRTDIDTRADLATTHGVGEHTARVLARADPRIASNSGAR